MEKPEQVDVISLPCIDHNDNHLEKDELCFIGYGEDESSQPKKIDMSKKWKLNEADITEILEKECSWDKLENGAFIQEMIGKFLMDGHFREVEFPDKSSALEALRSIVISINHSRPDLWQWLEQSNVLMGSSEEMDALFPIDSAGSSPRDSNGSSSLGIMSFSDMSSLSFASFDGIKNDKNTNTKEKANTTELIVEIEELHHQNKRLNEERSRLTKLIAQTEDSNNQLIHENEEMLKKLQSLQDLLDKLKGTEKDHDDAQIALQRLEEANQHLQNQLLKEERENKDLSFQLRNNNDLLLLSQLDMDSARQQFQEMSETLKESDLTISTLKEQYESSLGELKERAALLEEKENMIFNLKEVTESLKQQKHALELQLSRAEEEIASLQHAAKKDCTLERESELTLSSCSQSESSTSLEPPCQSTPLPVAKIASLRTEMRDAIADGQGPFCGKHIFPEALYQETNSIVSPFSSRKLSCSIVPHARKRRACLRCHFHLRSPNHDKKKARLVNRFAEGEDFDIDQNDARRLHCGANISEEVNGGIRDICQLLSRMKGYLYRLNADAAALIGNCAEPQTTVISENNTPLVHTSAPEENLGEHISAELKVLKDALSKTNAILSTLSQSQQFVVSMPSFLHDPHVAKGERKHYQSDLLPTSERKRHSWMKDRSISVSQKSTPLHRAQSLTRSCPNLRNQWHVATRGTQTEQQHSASPETNPRNRSASFIAAIQKGQSTTEDSETRSQHDNANLCLSAESCAYAQRKLSILPEEETDDDPSRIHQQHRVTHAQKQKLPPPYRPPPVPISSRSVENLTFECKGKPNVASTPFSGMRFPMERQKSLPSSFCFSTTSSVVFPGEMPFVFRGATNTGSINLTERSISDRKHSKHSHVRIARTESDDKKDADDDDDDEEEEEAHQLARKRRRSFSSGNYGLAFDHEEDEDGRAHQQIAAVHAVATSCLAKQSIDSKAATEQSKELKNKFLMPEMESSETESAKDSANGSMESETAEPPSTTNDEQQALASNFFKKSFFFKPDQLNDKEIEEKFSMLSLGFKTDKFTLGKRLELQKRQRDNAEHNIEEEVKKMKEGLVKLNQQCMDMQMRDLITDLQQRMDIINLSTSRMSSRSEVYGAVQQEERTNHAFEIMVTYVEQLKRLYDKEHHELEETRRLLLENRLMPEPTGGELFLDDNKRTLRSLSSTGKPGTRRRASVAVFHRSLLQDRGKSPVSSTLHTGALVELRPRISQSIINVNKDETLGTISILNDPKLEKESTPITRPSKDCAVPSDLLAGTRQPEMNAEMVSSLESSAVDNDVTVVRDDTTEETCAKDESSPNCNYSAEIAKTSIFRKAIIGGQKIIDYIPDEFPWEFSSVFRALRYGLVTLLLFGAFISLVSTFLPGKTSACTGQSPSSHFSFQEFFEVLFRPHLSFRSKHTPV